MPDIEKISDDPNIKIAYSKYVQGCGQLPFVSLQSRLGLYFSPFILYWFIFLYWITNFNFFLVDIINSSLLLFSFFLFYQTIKKEVKFSKYILLLALVSPLTISFSLMENMSWLIFFSSVVFFLLKPGNKNIILRQLILGIVLGIAVSSHIQFIPLLIAVFIWQYIRLKKFKPLAVLGLGIFFPVLFYLLMFLSTGKIEHIRFHVDNFTPLWLHLILAFNYIFRFNGIHPMMIINSSVPLKNIETVIAYIFMILNFVLSVLFFKKIGNFKSDPWFIQLIYVVSLVFLPLGILSNGGSEAHENLIYWWFTPLILGFVLVKYFSKPAKIIFSAIIAINLGLSLIQYSPKIFFSSINDIHGPSLIATLNSIDRLCERVDRSEKNRLSIYLDRTSLHPLSLHAIPAITIVRNTTCAEKISFTYEKNNTDIIFDNI